MPKNASIDAAMAVLDRFIAAFSARDVEAVRGTFHFPHARFHDGKITLFMNAEDFSMDFFLRSADAQAWVRSVWDERNVIHAGADKVHFDTQFSRLRADGSVINAYRSIYIVTRIGGHWGIQGRSSFAP
jgi:hypothetical protein